MNELMLLAALNLGVLGPVLIAILVAVVIIWGLSYMGVPEPINTVIKVIVAIAVVVYIFNALNIF